MIEITTTKTTADLQGVLDLQSQNQKRNVPPDVQREQGFVTLQYTLDQMQQMHNLGPTVIAKDGEQVVGYAITAFPQVRAFVPELETLFQTLDQIQYDGQPLNSHSFYLVGQVCVADGYRSQGIFDRMYEHHRALYSNQFRLFITDISMRNTRSLRAHERVGFQNVSQFYEPDAGEEWAVVVWDWKE